MAQSATATSVSKTFFRPRRLGHANLWVGNLKRFERFYNEVCGLTVEFWEPDLVATFLGTGNTPHDLGAIEVTGGKARYGRDGLLQIPEGIGATVGLGHIAWEMENEKELVDAIGAVKAAGIPFHMTVDHQVAHSIYMPDPDGNTVEYYCDTVKDWRSVVQGEMALITGGWEPGETEPFTEGRYDVAPEIRVVASAPVHPRRVTHVVLTTRDVPRLVQFYETVGGLSRVHEGSDGSVTCLRGTHQGYPFSLAICAHDGAVQAGYHHISFELGSEAEVESSERRLKERKQGVEHRIDDHGKRSFFLRDPDGMRVEFYARRTSEIVDRSAAPPALRPFLV
ncbi:MAG TPA: VOC family protein [Stellaceae bacterium]|nr:VOC family protein [Stellaceae bacterium]